jgi:hypothetical protein
MSFGYFTPLLGECGCHYIYIKKKKKKTELIANFRIAI